MIRISDIELSFEEKVIFQELSLTIEAHRHTCITGESGRGKTSLLHLMAGNLRPSAGEVYVNGVLLSAKTLPQIRAQLTWIPQNIHLPVENAKHLIQLLGIKHKETHIQQIAEKLGLTRKELYRDFSQISGGQKQRVLLAVCLSRDQDIVLMDEPTASLDKASVKLLIDCVAGLYEKTIVSVSHNSDWIQSVDKCIEL